MEIKKKPRICKCVYTAIMKNNNDKWMGKNKWPTEYLEKQEKYYTWNWKKKSKLNKNEEDEKID